MNLNTDDGLAELAEMEAQQLKKAMEKMPFDEQTVLLMKYQDDVSIREIAELHGVTESAVKMRLKRSRDKLRKYYLEGAVFWLLIGLKALFSIRWPFADLLWNAPILFWPWSRMPIAHLNLKTSWWPRLTLFATW